MRNWPHGSVRVPVDLLTVGDIVVVPGAGAYRINQLVTAAPLGRVALLGWDDLALILRRGTTRERVSPAPGAIPRRPTTKATTHAATHNPDQHQLAS